MFVSAWMPFLRVYKISQPVLNFLESVATSCPDILFLLLSQPRESLLKITGLEQELLETL